MTILAHGYDKTGRWVSIIGARAVYAGPTSPTIRQGESVTSQPQPVPGEGKSAGQYLRGLRDLAAYALVGAAGVFLFVAIIRLIPDGSGQFAGRTANSFYGFVSLETILFPLGAVLLALQVQPRHAKARLIVLAALVEYAAAAFFGVFFGLLVGLINVAANSGARAALEELLIRLGWLALFAVAAYAVFQIWQGLFTTPRAPKPVPQPGVYGQPQYNAPGAYPGQPGYGPPPGQPGYGQPAYGPPSGYPPVGTPAPAGPGPEPAPGAVPGQPGYGPTTYGQPPQNPTWNQPAMPLLPPAGPPASAYPAPVSAQPASGAPAPATFGDGAFNEPTQVVRQPEQPADDHTRKLDEDRPGFGPADQDPPRG